jgi:hypothetical protein
MMPKIRRLSGVYEGKEIVVFLTLDNIHRWMHLNFKVVRDA